MPIPVIDVFAGPGGLNEGFSSLVDVNGEPIFETVRSFEMDPWACETLRLRAALRHFRRGRRDGVGNPTAYYEFLGRTLDLAELKVSEDLELSFKHANNEVVEMALGPDTRLKSNAEILKGLEPYGGRDWVLIGGPPCQAYSLAGRSRRTSDPTFADDNKHVLYKEYLAILQRFEPTVFVMENVKGMLSSRHAGGAIFQSILNDLATAGAGYDIRSFVMEDEEPSPSGFVIRSEFYGVPQRRHRVILLGIKKGSGLKAPSPLLGAAGPVSVKEAIGDLPKIRSMVSPRRGDSDSDWRLARDRAWLIAGAGNHRGGSAPVLGSPLQRYEAELDGELASWLVDEQAEGITLHESRAHMAKDLQRYGYLALKARDGFQPKVGDLPSELMPNHKNAASPDAPFADRFRVQLRDQPSTTVVSHIAKDGHYYIHYDPEQMRSLSVREAARLQTFPDDYFFVGRRTHQYHQVGNAVPPLLARQLGKKVANMFGARVGDGRL